MKTPPELIHKIAAALDEFFLDINFFSLPLNSDFPNPVSTRRVENFETEERKNRKRKKGGSGGCKDQQSQQEHLPNFDDFWDKCPRKIAKGAARKAYKAALMKATPKEIIFGMERYARSCVGKDPKFICHPSTWLNQERWSDVECAPSPQIRVQEREAILRRITALEKERGIMAREFDIPRVREIDEQLALARQMLAANA